MIAMDVRGRCDALPRAEAMLIVMKMDASADDVEGVVAAARERDLKATPIPGSQRTAVGITGNIGVVEPARDDALPGVREIMQASHAHKLAPRA